MHKSEFINEIIERGFLSDCNGLEALDELAAKGPVTGYIGFDCTARSLHVGSLLQIMILRLFQRTGHKSKVIKFRHHGNVIDSRYQAEVSGNDGFYAETEQP